jgi:hypothetical protein
VAPLPVADSTVLPVAPLPVADSTVLPVAPLPVADSTGFYLYHETVGVTRYATLWF